MGKLRENRYIERIIILALIAAASILMLSNLGNHFLWQDEAQTALIAKSILTHWVPVGHDGINSFSQELGSDYGRNYIWKWHPWFSFYLLAAFFKLFGVSTLTARLPFALVGIAVIPLLYYFTKDLFGSRRTAFLAATLLLLCVPFLLLVRQCRYYTPDAFFALAALYSYHRLLESRKYAVPALLVSAFFLFHTQYVHFAALLATLVIHSLLFRRDKLRMTLLLSAALVLVNLPWIIWFSTMTNVVQDYQSPFIRAFNLGIAFTKQLSRNVFPPLLLLVLPVSFFICWNRGKRLPSLNKDSLQNVSLLLIYVLINLAALSFAVEAPFFRSLTPVIPVLCVFIALIVESAVKIHPAVGTALVLVLLATRPVPDFIYEITHDYNGPIEGIVKYLNKHGKPSDTVAITYGDMPLKLYTKMRVVGGLTGEDLSEVAEADWVIMRKNIICEKDYAVAQYIAENLDPVNYKPVVLDYPDIPFENREDPDLHNYKTVTKAQPVVIFRRFK